MSDKQGEWWRFVKGECMGHSLGDEPQTLTRCQNYMKPVIENLSG